MKPIQRDDLMAEDKPDLLPVEVPEWNGVVYLRRILSGELYDLIDESEGKPASWYVQRLLVLSLCDEHGNRLLNDDEMDVLRRKSADVIQRLTEKAASFNNLRAEAAEAMGREFAANPSDSSSS